MHEDVGCRELGLRSADERGGYWWWLYYAWHRCHYDSIWPVLRRRLGRARILHSNLDHDIDHLTTLESSQVKFGL